MGVKRPEMGSKWRLLVESATSLITAQLLFRQAIRSRVASDESLERNGRKSHFYIKLRRKPSSPNFCRKPEYVALCSILTPAGWECCTRLGARQRRRTPTIVGRGTWEEKRVASGGRRVNSGAWSVAGEAEGSQQVMIEKRKTKPIRSGASRWRIAV